MGCRPARSTTWCRPWGCPASPRAKSPGCAARSTIMVNGFLDRPLEGDWPYLWLDATYVKVRQTGRIVSVAATVAAGRQRPRPPRGPGRGDRRVGGRDLLDRVPALAGPARSPAGQLVISDVKGLKAAVTRILGATMAALPRALRPQPAGPCRRSGRRVVSARRRHRLRPDADSAKAQWRQVADQLRPKVPKLAVLRWTKPSTPSSPTMSFPRVTARNCTPQTRSNGSMPRSSAAPTSSVSFPTKPNHHTARRRHPSRGTTSGPSQGDSMRWNPSLRWAMVSPFLNVPALPAGGAA